ncbi:hypothetical protein A3839_20250 [Achromobacter insolitus]|nr:hypothetical protein A3839_20250 [Achromobacter insolitus]
MPPIIEPARLRRFMIKANTSGASCGVAGAPTSVIVPSRLSSAKKAFRSCGAATVLRIKSRLCACATSSSGLRDTTTSSAHSDAGAQRRRHCRQLRLGMADAQHVAFVHDDALGVTAQSVPRPVRRRTVIGTDQMVAPGLRRR